MAEVIDAHHHLWRYSEADYKWISPEMSVLKRDFLLDDLGREMLGAGVDGTVVVQARQNLLETRWLLACAEASPLIRGVVGWVPFMDCSVIDALTEFRGSSKLKGLRHVVQSEPDDFILSEDFNAGISCLQGTELVYDILIHERQLPQTVEFVCRHPEQIFVLDHVAKPKILAGEIEPWRRNLFALAESGEIYCKVSGMATEADWEAWTLDGLRPYLDAAMEAFGPERLMVGSDWPVCLLASSYRQWWDSVQDWLKQLSGEHRSLILGETAKKVYRLH